MFEVFDSDNWQEVIATLRRNKLRTFMTASGVFWGIFMLVIMLGFGNGLEDGVTRNMVGFATNAIYVWGQRTSIPYKGMQPGRRMAFENRDIDAIRREVHDVEWLAPRIQLGGWQNGINVSYREKTGNFGVMGEVPALEHIESFRVSDGRFIDDIDMRERRKVAVVGEDVVTILFGADADPIGKVVKIQGVNFLIVGIFTTDQPGEDGARVKLTVDVPFTTFQDAFNQHEKVGWFSMTAYPDVPGEQVEAQVKRLLAVRHGASPDDPQAIGSYNSAKDFGKVRGVFLGIKFFIWFVGIVTLLAGMLGVSNIMLIVVKERTREFGVRKAIGATPGSIVALVIQEALTLTAAAGYTGLVVGVAFLEFSSATFGDPSSMLGRPTLDFTVALIAVGVLMVAGLLAGIVPARHASRINPVEALRSE